MHTCLYLRYFTPPDKIDRKDLYNKCKIGYLDHIGEAAVAGADLLLPAAL